MGIGDVVKEAYACSYIQWPTVDPNREESVLICSFVANPRPGADMLAGWFLLVTIGHSLGIWAYVHGPYCPSTPTVNTTIAHALVVGSRQAAALS